MFRLILLDLDGTLLRSDKTISGYTLSVLRGCREKGLLIGISTSRGASNAERYISAVQPQVVISSGGALVSCFGKNIYRQAFSAEETRTLINTALTLTGGCEVTVDTEEAHYWNFRTDPREFAPDWGETVYTDYSDFTGKGLKICAELPDRGTAEKVAASVPDCDMARFSDGGWYKFSAKSATKSAAVLAAAEFLKISADEIIAFGDDFVDLEMLKICGRGVAPANAIDEVKAEADDICGDNDSDGVAKYLEKEFLAY